MRWQRDHSEARCRGWVIFLLLSVAATSQAQPSTAASLPGEADPLREVVGLRERLNRELDAILQSWKEVQPRVEALRSSEPPGLRAATIESGLVNTGLQTCFAAVNDGACTAPPVEALRQYLLTLEPELKLVLERKLAATDALRQTLSSIVVRSRLLSDQAIRARQETERLTQAAFLVAQETDENPLERASVKARKAADWQAAQQERERIAEAAVRIDREIRPLEVQVASVRARVLEELSGVSPPGRP